MLPACQCADIRSAYDSQAATITAYKTTVDGFTYAKVLAINPTPGFNQAEFEAIRGPVDEELGAVLEVRGLQTGMLQVLIAQRATFDSELKTVYRKVREQLDIPGDSEIDESTMDYVLEGLTLAGEITGAEPVAKLLGGISAIVKLSIGLSNDSAGNDKDALGVTVDNLLAGLSEQFTDSLTTQSRTFGDIYSDWGRLSTVSEGCCTRRRIGMCNPLTPAKSSGHRQGVHAELVPGLRRRRL